MHYHKHHELVQRVEIDYKGDSPGLGYVDKLTGEFIECRLFGAVLCNSRLFFPYASINEKQESWLAGIESSLKCFSGVTATLVVDNIRCAVNRADWYDPDINQEFFSFVIIMTQQRWRPDPAGQKIKTLLKFI